MQVSKITSFYVNKLSNFNKSNSNKVNLNTTVDTFEKSKQISFKAYMDDIIKYSVDWGYSNIDFPDENGYTIYFPKQRKLNILRADEDRMNDISESLCMYRDEDIENFARIYFVRPYINHAKSQKALAKLMPYIEKQRTKLSNLHIIKEEFDKKSKLGELSDISSINYQYVLEEIERIDKKNRKAKQEYLDANVFEFNNSDDIQLDY